MKNVLFLIACVILVALTGCGHAIKSAPHMGYGNLDIEAGFDRSDMVVMKTIEGSSSMANYFGIVQIVDGDKLQLFGIPFFKDKYTYWENNKILNRAYYKALAAVPDADAVFQKSYDFEIEGIPFILGVETVTVKGKAIRLKSDK